MIASNISLDILLSAATELHIKMEYEAKNQKGNRFSVKLYPLPLPTAFNGCGTRYRGEAGDAPYQRISKSYYMNERRTHAVCWHGFRDFFRACFALAPNAKFRTAIATWNGSDDFENRFRNTGFANVGSIMCPVRAIDVCRCPERGTL